MFQKTSVKLLFGGLGLLLFLLGLATFGVPAMSYIRSVILLTAMAVLFVEVGVKKWSNLSSLKKLGVQQWITLIVSVLIGISGILSLPFLVLEVPFITQFAGYFLLAGGVLAIGEAVLPNWF
jgi:uncharacterized membrane protein HdeD (DUF308 family)